MILNDASLLNEMLPFYSELEQKMRKIFGFHNQNDPLPWTSLQEILSCYFSHNYLNDSFHSQIELEDIERISEVMRKVWNLLFQVMSIVPILIFLSFSLFFI
jgi:hypothetical protein